MPRVTILTHSEFVHAKSGTHFVSTTVRNDEGAAVILGVAEVADDVAREHFASHPAFRVEGLAEAETPKAEKPAPAKRTK
jgi:hypothetical protein